MAQSTQAEPVLARAVELYEEGLAYEQAHEPERAIDRYRRATRMASEREIVSRIQQREEAATRGETPSAPPVETGLLPGRGHVSNNEDFELWRALHVSRLEAEVEAGGQTYEFVTGEFNQNFSSTLPSGVTVGEDISASSMQPGTLLATNAFAPPPRRPATSKQRAIEDEDYSEIADHIALRKLRSHLGESEATGSELGMQLPKSRTIAGSNAELEECSLIALLREEVPDVFNFLDPYALDRLARACAALLSMSRSTSAWRELARRFTTEAEHASMLAGLGPGPDARQYWRGLVLSSPRLRADGVYIATCGYSRRIAAGASLTDSRQFMHVRYYRLLRFLPSFLGTDGEPIQRALILKYDGDEITRAVDALKTHPAAQALVRVEQDAIPSVVRKLHEKVVLGTYTLHRETMVASVKHVGNSLTNLGESIMDFKLRHGRRDGSRQNCRLTWERNYYHSPQDRDVTDYNLQREQHFAPFTFARVVALECLL